MIAQAVFLALSQALLIQTISAQCIGAYEPLGVAWGAYGSSPWGIAPAAGLEYPGYSPYSLAASNGGGFAVSSVSPIAPTGVYLTSENVYDGAVLVSGQLPFLSAVALEGPLPSVGAGVIAYGCGNGNVAILSEDIAPVGFGPAGPYGYGPASPALGYGPGPISYGGPLGFGAGCGCGALF